MDPVNEDDPANKAIRYVMDNFTGVGQDSFQIAPAQDQSQWQSLKNVMPVAQGVMKRRWGYTPLATGIASATDELFEFQRDSDGTRYIVGTGGVSPQAISEDGVLSNPAIFTPTDTTDRLRMVPSRSYAYFYNGAAADYQKWNGDTTDGVSNWGIAVDHTVGSVTQGPLGPGTGSITGGWANPNNAKIADAIYSNTSIASFRNSTGSLYLSNFGFFLPPTAIIQGIQVDVLGYSENAVTNVFVKLTPDGVAGGTEAHLAPTSNAYTTYGGPTDLWTQSWSPANVGNTDFGVLISAFNSDIFNPVLLHIDFVRITITYLVDLSSINVADTTVAGDVTLTVGRIYYCVFSNPDTGMFSDLNAASQSTGPITSKKIGLNSIPVSTDPQVTQKVILATADGGDPALLYFVAQIPNADVTYVDDMPEDTLLLQQLYLFTDDFGNEFGVSDNDPPPSGGKFAIKYKGRIWMAVGQNLYFSKSTTELTLPNGFIAGKYEEAFPPSAYFDISEGAETVSGLLTDGNVLYIGTERHVRRLFGDDPSNFSEPEVVHPEVGVLNQETWKVVFTEGTPTGALWLTPDFRVIGSDFNTYTDMGAPIQDVLNSINPLTARATAHAMYVSDGEFDIYILALPTGSNTFCDTHCAFDLRKQKWFVWKPTNQSQAMMFNINAAGLPQWLFVAGSNLMQYNQNTYQDNGVSFQTLAKTSWLHLGAPTTRKILDELEVIGDSSILVTIEGASTQADFLTPTILKNAVPLVTSPFGQLKVYLATVPAKYRYYRLTFSVTDQQPDFLDQINFKAIPFNTL